MKNNNNLNYYSIIKNTIIIIITGIILNFSSILFAPIYIKSLGEINYGILLTVSTVSIIITTIISFNNTALFTRFHSIIFNKEKYKSFVFTFAIFQLIIITLFLLINFITNGFIFNLIFTSIKFEPFLKYSLLIGVFNSLQSIPLGIFLAKQKIWLYRILPIMSFILNYIYIYFKIYNVNGEILDALNGQLFVSVIIAIFSSSIIIYHSRFNFKRTFLIIGLRFTLPLVLYTIFALLTDLLIKQRVEANIGVIELGRYGLLSLISTIPLILFTSFNTIYLPSIYNLSSKDAIKTSFLEYSELGTHLVQLIIFLIATNFVIVTNYFNNALYNDFVHEWLFYILLFGNNFFGIIWIHLSNEMVVNRNTGTYFSVTLISFFSTLLFSYFLISKYGIIGVAITSVLSNFVIALVAYILVKKKISIGINYNKIFKISITYFCFFITYYIILLLFKGYYKFILQILFTLLALIYFTYYTKYFIKKKL